MYSCFKRKSFAIWTGTITFEKQLKRTLRIWYRIILSKFADAFIAYGSLTKKYLMQLGIDEDKIFVGLNTVDTEFFAKKVEEYRAENSNNSGLFQLLYIGYLSPRKRVQKLLEVVSILKESRLDFELVVVGDGSDRKKLEQLADQLKIRKFVRFEGFKQRNELIPFLANSDLFLFPTSYDIWGLTIIEAMSAAIPCISSSYAGVSYDIINSGVNFSSVANNASVQQ